MSSVVLITGAGRGLGLEFARQYAADGWDVLATVRDTRRADALRALTGKVEVLALDVADGASVAALALALKGQPVDLLINNAGVYGPETGGIGAFDYAAWAQVLVINTLGPVRVLEAVLPNLRAGRRKQAVTVTSLMGSIGDNDSGGALCYRSSKAALNAAMKTLAVDLRPDGICVAVLHPGWVRTDMGGPHAPMESPASVAGMRRVVEGLTLEDSGRFLNHDGRELPW